MNHHKEAISAITMRRYKLAAENMIFEFLGDSIIKYKPKQLLRLQQHVTNELKQQRNRIVKWKYSGRMEINNRTDLAEEIYERTLPALESFQDNEDIIDI